MEEKRRRRLEMTGRPQNAYELGPMRRHGGERPGQVLKSLKARRMEGVTERHRIGREHQTKGDDPINLKEEARRPTKTESLKANPPTSPDSPRPATPLEGHSPRFLLFPPTSLKDWAYSASAASLTAKKGRTYQQKTEQPVRLPLLT
jgi:hypothetical protein